MKAKETVNVFARSAPAVAKLLANRVQSFDPLHLIPPSSTTPGIPLELTVQAWDLCDRLHRTFAMAPAVTTTDQAAGVPNQISFRETDAAIVRTVEIMFDTPGVRHLSLRSIRQASGWLVSEERRIVSSFEPVALLGRASKALEWPHGSVISQVGRKEQTSMKRNPWSDADR